MAVARMKYHQPNQRVMKSRTSLIVDSAAAGAASAQTAKATTMTAEAMKTVRLTRRVGNRRSPVLVSAWTDVDGRAASSLMDHDASPIADGADRLDGSV